MKKRYILLTLMILCCFGNLAFSKVRLICPDDIELGCNPKKIPIPNANKLEYETDCKKAKVKLIDRLLIEDQENCKNFLTLTYEATDDCGDTDRCSMTISWMVDEEKPVFVNCPGPIDLGCNPEGLPAPDPDQLEATDNCGIKAIVFHNQKFKTNKCKTTLTREYRAYDNCGNYASCFQEIIWTTDTEPPKIDCKDIRLGCNFDGAIPQPDPSTVKAKDNCCLEGVSYLFDSDIVVFGCEYSLLRYWEAVDCCGNRDTCAQSISWLNDPNPPVFTSCPPDIDLGCNPDLNDLADPSLNYVAAKDDCGDVKIELVDNFTENEGCEYKRFQRWKATDECGNMSFCSRTISYIIDKEAPVIISCPPDLDLGCVDENFQIPSATPELVEWEDDCGAEVTVLPFIDIVVFNCTYSFGYVYIVTDNCGNADTCFQNISWTFDNTPPVFTLCPPDLDLGCNPDLDDLADPSINAVAAEDFCGEVKIDRLEDEVIIGEDCRYKRIQTWKATDKCGNMSTCQRVISYTLDNEAPIITSCPPDIDFGCVGQDFEIPDPRPGDVIFEDNCGAEVEVLPFLDIVVVNCTFSFGYVYIVTDNCGNADTCIQHISWTRDDTPPQFTQCPPDIDLGCNPDLDDIADPSLNAVAAEDFCGEVEIERLEDEILILEDCTYKRLQTWKATDRCGNMSTCQRVIKYTLDDEPPVITSCPPDIDFGCVGQDFEIPDPRPGDVIFEDNCGAEVEVLPFLDIVVVNCTFSFGYVYIVTDNCGNADTCIQHISWTRDDTPPQFTQCPPDIDLGCNPDLDDIADPSLNAVAAEDFCGEVEIERLEDEILILEDCTYKRLQTWKATDRCGNMSTCQRVIKYTLDDEPPVITSCPPDIDFGCVGQDFEIPDPRPGDVIFEDNCGAEVEVLPFLDIVVVNCTFSFGYVYIVTDNCGNADTCIQHISWTRDEIGPAFTYCPQNIDLGCNPDQESIVEALNDEPIVEDFCGEVIVDLNEVRVQDGCMIFINQRWAAFDGCENVTVCSRTIKYTLDNEQPVVISCPENAHLGCLNIAPFFAPFDEDDYDVTDNCGNVNFTHYDQIIESENEECLFTFRRFVTIFDDCGNLNSCVTEYTWYQVNDTNLDIPFPEDITIICEEIPRAPEFEERNCGIGVPELLQEITVGDCATGNCTVFRAWLKKDCDGNLEVHIQTITLFCQDITTLRNDIETRNLGNEGKIIFKVFPNPTTNTLNINTNISKDSPYQIMILDQTGKLIFNEGKLNGGNGTESIDVTSYAPGLYYIEFRSEGSRSIQKWIKAK